MGSLLVLKVLHLLIMTLYACNADKHQQINTAIEASWSFIMLLS